MGHLLSKCAQHATLALVVGLAGLPKTIAASDDQFNKQVDVASNPQMFLNMHTSKDHHDKQVHADPGGQMIQNMTTASLSKADLNSRNIKYTILFVGSSVLITALGAAAVCKKRGKLSIGHLDCSSGCEVYWRGKVICCPARYTAVGQADQGNEAASVEQGLEPDAAAEPSQEVIEKMLAKQKDDMEKEQAWLKKRSALLAVLFGSYVASSVGIPLWKADTVSCSNGFFWEDHLLFFGVFMTTKIVEVGLFAFDPTIQGELDLVKFMIKFLPSFLGYLDGYTDATSIVIAHSCKDSSVAQMLSMWMAGLYLSGVIVGQWTIVACLARKDPTDACFMKLMHLDALSSCISLPQASKDVWSIVTMSRTFGEDIPQAICQTLFLIYVKQNYFMILSVAVSVGSSIKALHDALHRSALADGVKIEEDPTPAEEVPEEEEEEANSQDLCRKMCKAAGFENELPDMDQLRALLARHPEAVNSHKFDGFTLVGHTAWWGDEKLEALQLLLDSGGKFTGSGTGHIETGESAFEIATKRGQEKSLALFNERLATAAAKAEAKKKAEEEARAAEEAAAAKAADQAQAAAEAKAAEEAAAAKAAA